MGSRIIEGFVTQGVPRENIFVPLSKKLDLREKKNCEKAVQGRHIVIHAAGITGGGEFHRDHPGEILYGNLVMGVELMEAARKAGVEKFITIGSAAEYPEHAPMPLREEDLWQGPLEALHAPYAAAKKILLLQGQAYRKQYGFNAIHLLMANMYGPGDKRKNGFVIPMLIERVKETKECGGSFIEVWGTGKPTRDFLYVDDAARGIILAVEEYDKLEPVNIASGIEISIKELVAIISELMEFRGEIRWNTEKPDGQARRLLDATKAEREFGFKAAIGFREGLQKTIAAYLASFN